MGAKQCFQQYPVTRTENNDWLLLGSSYLLWISSCIIKLTKRANIIFFCLSFLFLLVFPIFCCCCIFLFYFQKMSKKINAINFTLRWSTALEVCHPEILLSSNERRHCTATLLFFLPHIGFGLYARVSGRDAAVRALAFTRGPWKPRSASARLESPLMCLNE